MRRSQSARSVLLLLAMIATACASTAGPEASGGTGSPSGPAGGQPSPSSSQGGPGAVPEILDFEGSQVGGGTLRGAELAGAPVAIWFWAPW